MALKGTLKDFSVADIFQLIGHQSKSGSLYVRKKDAEAHIIFDEGKIVLGTFRKSDDNFLLGTMLLRAGVITSEQLAMAVEDQRASMRSLGDILISMKAISKKILSEFIALQLKEILFRLFQWKDGFYEFVPEKIKFNKAIIRPQSAEGVLMDAFRMLDEWPAIEQKVQSLENVFQATVDIGTLAEPRPQEDQTDDELDAAFGEFDEEAPPKPDAPGTPALGSDERKVLRLLDGHRTLQEVVYLSRLGTFEAARIAALLLDRRLVSKVEELFQTRLASRDEIEGDKWGRWLSHSYAPLLIAFGLSCLLPIIAFGVRSHWSGQYSTFSEEGRRLYEDILSPHSLRMETEKEQIENILDVYLLENGSYPSSLEMVSDEWKVKSWQYEPKDRGYSLTPSWSSE